MFGEVRQLMDYHAMAEELYTLHFSYEKSFYRWEDRFATKGEDGVLLWLSCSGRDMFSGDIVQKLGLTSGRVANILKALEKKGYITRKNDGADGRRVIVSLTESGRAYIQAVREKNIARRANFLEKFGEKDAAEYLRLIKKAFDIVNQ